LHHRHHHAQHAAGRTDRAARRLLSLGQSRRKRRHRADLHQSAKRDHAAIHHRPPGLSGSRGSGGKASEDEKMLMTRFLLVASSVLIGTLSAVAVGSLFAAYDEPPRLAVATLIVTAVAWPMALIIAYRVGQATNAVARHKASAKIKKRVEAQI